MGVGGDVINNHIHLFLDFLQDNIEEGGGGFAVIYRVLLVEQVDLRIYGSCTYTGINITSKVQT